MLNKETLPGKVVRISLSVLFCIVALVPIYSALIVSLTPYANMLEPQLIPKYFEISNYALAFDFIQSNVLNSFIYAIAATALTTIISVPAAYALARYRFRLRKIVLMALLITQMTAGIVILPSLYRMFNAMGLINSPISLVIVYTAINLALVVTIHHGYFLTLPVELDEAAEIDGCNYLQIIMKVILPVSGPGIAVGSIFVFINSYNEFVVPLFLLRNAKQYPLTLTVYSLLTDTTIRWHIMAAASLIGILPPVIIFMLFQKYIIQGVIAGAIKG